MNDNRKDSKMLVATDFQRSRLKVVAGTDFTSGFENDNSRPYDDIKDEKVTEGIMTDISRSELQALLKANKAEVDAVASAMKTEMANWREVMRADIKDMKSAVERQSEKLDHNFSSQQVKLDAAIQIQTAKLEKTVSDTRIDIIRWVLGVPALAFTLWKIYEVLSK